jgi:predicted NodU family carbamoyl transferase
VTDLVLGISAFYHDSAAALVADKRPVGWPVGEFCVEK